jgi:hypothetical protein
MEQFIRFPYGSGFIAVNTYGCYDVYANEDKGLVLDSLVGQGGMTTTLMYTGTPTEDDANDLMALIARSSGNPFAQPVFNTADGEGLNVNYAVRVTFPE